eukprot:scaffold20662_cov66-Phaeocystis_antarctica.AAC.6
MSWRRRLGFALRPVWIGGANMVAKLLRRPKLFTPVETTHRGAHGSVRHYVHEAVFVADEDLPVDLEGHILKDRTSIAPHNFTRGTVECAVLEVQQRSREGLAHAAFIAAWARLDLEAGRRALNAACS